MSLLRIRASLVDPPTHCQWTLLGDREEVASGEGRLADLPQRARRVQLLIPAAQVLLTRAHLPRGARRGPGAVLAFAVEEKLAGEPDATLVSWLGSVDGEDALVAIDKAGLQRWQQSLAAVGIGVNAVQSEILLLPLRAGEWSVAWFGAEGFVRSGEFEGAATDCGDRDAPPLCLRLMLDEARLRHRLPTAIAIHAQVPDAAPDLVAWERALGVGLRLADAWDWHTAPADAGVALQQPGRRWGVPAGIGSRLRAAAWLFGAALAVHAGALLIDWARLAGEQRSLRQTMETRFRTTFPEAVAVADPALQMRRKLAEARHAAGIADSGDFLPLIERVAAAAKELPAGSVRTVAYGSGRMTLAVAAAEEAAMQRFRSRLLRSGLTVETVPAAPGATGAARLLIVGAA